MTILAYNESKIDTRRCNLTGYILFFICTFALLVLDLATSRKGGVRNFIGICNHCCCFRSCRCPCLRWNVLFLAISTFFKVLFILLYAFIFPKLPIVKYYHLKAASEGSKTVSAYLAAGGIRTEATQGLKSM
ncbi:unnamed protein product [Camellia sinensis]